MKKILFLLAAFLLILSCGSTGEEKEEESPGQTAASDNSESIESDTYFIGREETAQNLRYHAYVDELLKGNIKGVSFETLRTEYASSTYYNPYEIQKSILHLKNLYEEEKYKDVIEIARQNIRVLAAEIDFHLYVMLTYKALGEEDFYKYHSLLMTRLIESILDSGDGLTPDTAFKVISVHEEHVVLNYLGYQRISQELLQNGIHSFDKIVAEKEGVSRDFFFNVDIPIKWLSDRTG